jgi:3D (Asp-Asp-Asp) domain-containing protein
MTGLELVFIGTLTVTAYRSVPEQTDTTPFITSMGERTHKGGCAVSRDLLAASLPYGTFIYIEDIGVCHINDTTNARHKRLVDVWVPSRSVEKHVGVKKRRVYKLIYKTLDKCVN